MNTDPIKNEKCLRGGCARWWGATKAGLKLEECSRCGFDKEENARRIATPLTLCADGLLRKIIPRKPWSEIPKEEGGEKDG